MENLILAHRKAVVNNIQKSFEGDFEKSFPIGTIRVWDGVQYRKVDNGEWVKVKGEKESSVAASGMIKKFKYTHSPKSDSEYLVDEKEGIVYRIADHWGRCASCNWDIKNNDGNFISADRYVVLAKCRFKDMKMNDNDYRYRFDNPKYVEKFIELGRKKIESVFNLISRDDVYFTDKAKKMLKVAVDIMKYNYKLKYDGALGKMVDNLIEKFNNIP